MEPILIIVIQVLSYVAKNFRSMETQTVINIFFALAFILYVAWSRNPSFNKINCKELNVADKDGKIRIAATIFADGQASVLWFDKDGKRRIAAVTSADGSATVILSDKDGKMRIGASTVADGNAGVQWDDKDGKVRISAGTFADGTVDLPTEDLIPPKKP